MCWSADADLAAGSVITAIGIGCVVSAAHHRHRLRDIPLAALPLVLGAHQLIESVVWRGTEGEVSASTASTARTIWAVIALPLLPFFVPWAVYLASTPASRAVRERLRALALLGTFAAVWLTVTLLQNPVDAVSQGHTLFYGIGIPYVAIPVSAYLAATLGSLLAAPDPTIRLLGIACTVGALACIALWTYQFTSTWCALAAVASLILLRWARTRPSGSSAPPGPRLEALSNC